MIHTLNQLSPFIPLLFQPYKAVHIVVGSPLQCAIGVVVPLTDTVLLALVVVDSRQQCAIRAVPLPDTVLLAVVVVASPPQCAIAPVVLPDTVQLAVVVVASPPQCAIWVVALPDPVASAFCIELIY